MRVRVAPGRTLARVSIPGVERFRRAFLAANHRPERLAFILSRYRFGEACGPDLIARVLPSIRNLRLKRICLRQLVTRPPIAPS